MRRNRYPAPFSFFIYVEVVGLTGSLFALVFVREHGACMDEADRTVESDFDSVHFTGEEMRARDKTVEDITSGSSLAGRIDQDEIRSENALQFSGIPGHSPMDEHRVERLEGVHIGRVAGLRARGLTARGCGDQEQ